MASLNAPESSAAPEDNSADDYALSMNMGGVLEEQAGALESLRHLGPARLLPDLIMGHLNLQQLMAVYNDHDRLLKLPSMKPFASLTRQKKALRCRSILRFNQLCFRLRLI